MVDLEQGPDHTPRLLQLGWIEASNDLEEPLLWQGREKWRPHRRALGDLGKGQAAANVEADRARGVCHKGMMAIAARIALVKAPDRELQGTRELLGKGPAAAAQVTRADMGWRMAFDVDVGGQIKVSGSCPVDDLTPVRKGSIEFSIYHSVT